MINKEILTSVEAAAMIKSGQTVMVGGFMGCGSPPQLLDSLKQAGTKGLTLVCNDCGWYLPDRE